MEDDKLKQYRDECMEAYDMYDRLYDIREFVPDAICPIVIERPEKPDNPEAIPNFGKPPKERKFPLMSKREIQKYEALAYSENPIDKETYKAFVKREWERRINGFFFYNGYNLEWITGWNYVWLQYWWISGPDPETGRMAQIRPMFKDAQRDVYYIFWWLLRQKKCAGIIWLSYRRFGKALSINTPIPTPNGFKLMKDIQAGEYVIGSNGKPTRVTAVTGIQHGRNVNEVCFDDGTRILADDDHQWRVTRHIDRKYTWIDGEKPKEHVLTTAQMKREGIYDSGENNFHIQINAPVEYDVKETPKNPYDVGYAVSKFGGAELHVPNEYRSIENSSVPEIYKQGSINQRISFIQGIFDSEGTADENENYVSLRLKSKNICNDVVEVLRSLGEKVWVTNRKIYHDGGYVRTIYTIKVHTRFNPFTNVRGIDWAMWEIKKKTKPEGDMVKKITAIKEVKSRPVKCISVDAPDSLYLAGRGYTTTHNSAISMFAGLMDTTENPQSRFPVQHKNLKDGEKAFKKFVIDGWKKLPLWYKPEDIGQTSYKNHITFGSQMKRNVDVKDRVNEDVLNSEIFVMDSKEGAVDGDYATWFVRDEAAKTLKHVDIEESWFVTREALFVNAKKIGNAILTSTAEDMEKYGSGMFLSLWNKSNPDKLLPNGFTESYLYPLFIPAYYGFMDDDDDDNDKLVDKSKKFMDEWGYSNIEVCKKYHEDFYAALTGNSLLSRKRKYPVTFLDAWMNGDMRNTFPINKLVEQKIFNDKSPNVVRGNFEWFNGIRDSYVIWRPTEEGKWLVIDSWMPNENDRNKYEQRGNYKYPTREGIYIGVDPFSHSATVEYGSMGAAVTVVKHDPYNSSIAEGTVAMYHFREEEPYLFAEDILMQAVFMSAKILPERNTHGFIDHIKKRGYEGYLMKDPLEKDPKKLMTSEYGFPNNDNDKRESLMTITGSYFRDRLGQNSDGGYGICPFNVLLDQCINFESKDWQKYDLVVAYMLAVTAMRAVRSIKKTSMGPENWISGLTNEAKHKLETFKTAMANTYT